MKTKEKLWNDIYNDYTAHQNVVYDINGRRILRSDLLSAIFDLNIASLPPMVIDSIGRSLLFLGSNCILTEPMVEEIIKANSFGTNIQHLINSYSIDLSKNPKGKFAEDVIASLISDLALKHSAESINQIGFFNNLPRDPFEKYRFCLDEKLMLRNWGEEALQMNANEFCKYIWKDVDIQLRPDGLFGLIPVSECEAATLSPILCGSASKCYQNLSSPKFLENLLQADVARACLRNNGKINSRNLYSKFRTFRRKFSKTILIISYTHGKIPSLYTNSSTYFYLEHDGFSKHYLLLTRDSIKDFVPKLLLEMLDYYSLRKEEEAENKTESQIRTNLNPSLKAALLDIIKNCEFCYAKTVEDLFIGKF